MRESKTIKITLGKKGESRGKGKIKDKVGTEGISYVANSAMTRVELS